VHSEKAPELLLRLGAKFVGVGKEQAPTAINDRFNDQASGHCFAGAGWKVNENRTERLPLAVVPRTFAESRKNGIAAGLLVISRDRHELIAPLFSACGLQFRAMYLDVAGSRRYLKVFRAIVSKVAVDVVDNFAMNEVAPYFLLGNHTVHVPTVELYVGLARAAVPQAIAVASAECSVAAKRAELAPRDAILVNEISRAALLALQTDPHFVLSMR
jgi:hypothetical protein